MVRNIIDNIIPSSVPTDGWVVEYRIKGSTGPYITAPGSPFTALPIVFTTDDAGGTLYEGTIRRDCGDLNSTIVLWSTDCECSTDFSLTNDGKGCTKVDTVPATVTNSGFCLAPSRNGAYSNYGGRIYKKTFNTATLFATFNEPDPNIERYLNGFPWNNPDALEDEGVLNDVGVWIDSDCDGNQDSIAEGVHTTIGYTYNNTTKERTVLVGIAGDNQFSLKVNGQTVADTGSTVSDMQFKIWHIFMVDIIKGVNYFNAVAVGDGSVQDSIGMVIYDNTPLELEQLANIKILFSTKDLRGKSYDVSTCAVDYSLDVSNGQGNYVCRKTIPKICNSSDLP